MRFISWLGRIQMPSMMREYAQLIHPPTDISPDKHTQLLRMSFERLIYGFTVMPIIAALAALFYGRQHSIWLMGLWAVGYVGAFFYRKRLIYEFDEDAHSMDGHAMMARWVPKLKRIVTMHGLALCAPFVLTASDPSFEFNTLWYLVIAAIVASNAAHQTPVLGIFVRFFNCSWNVATLLSVIAYPDDWYYITPMILMFTGANYRHAMMAHKFFLQQVRLEESSTRLATQFKEAKEAAEDALIAKNRFLATASHDLRQPVHAMSMLIEAISQRNQDATLSPALADLRSSLRSMNLMFNSLLDLSKLESGVIAVEHKPVHLQAFLHEIARLFEHDARDRRLELRLHLPKQAAFAQTDANLLRQIILNLMQNALRYTQHGGVLLAIRQRGGTWQIEVCDTGIGVAKESQSDIYLPYFRQKLAWGLDSEGHGLGLSVVARCALLLKSPLDMSSRLGRGSRFWIRVPSLSAGVLQTSAGDASFEIASYKDHALSPINQGHCLIVEDDPQVGRAWQALMQSWGVDVRIVSNSAEAFECLSTGFVPQALVCDERLRAGESGFELLKALMERIPQARGAMVSGEFNAPALAQAEEEGFLVLRKPVDIGLVHDLLSRWLMAQR
ncbi:hybrid sensor histidine kinase/response regulator [Variovorax sp. PCZ-1]|uniref:hybrid sensor histidine kinase/response regulator n=1 Tax=Variovorax sp. PCZ-1 TaxID=2835533 RepID=UPI001BCB756E|nr:hybrid sensor histidine kinase/response regulator [Variovorax sp. PCZ-1]MBS7806826.1 hybrid sensor histidine kinase/response regulator [Variovorax sp. PCZ-1]